MRVTLTRRKVNEIGAVSYGVEGSRGTLLVTKHIIGDNPPETLELEGDFAPIPPAPKKERKPKASKEETPEEETVEA